MSPVGPDPVRAYLPVTAAALARALEDGEVAVATAHAVTPSLREWYTEGDLEELEYVALTEAAQQCLALLAADADAPRRRLVLAVDLPAGSLRPVAPGRDGVGGMRSLVETGGAVGWAAVVSLHVDEAEAEPEVSAAVDAVAARAAAAGTVDPVRAGEALVALRAGAALDAAPGDAEHERAVEAVEDAEALDLLWYDLTEARELLAELLARSAGEGRRVGIRSAGGRPRSPRARRGRTAADPTPPSRSGTR